MVITCPKCEARYRLDWRQLKGRGAWLTCPRCDHSFIVWKGESEPPEPAPQEPGVTYEPRPAHLKRPEDLDRWMEELKEEGSEPPDHVESSPTIRVVAPGRRRSVAEEPLEELSPVAARSRAADLDFRDVGITSWKVKVAIGLIYDFSDISTLKKYLVDKKVTVEDLISPDGKDWVRIGDIEDLDLHFLEVWHQRKTSLDSQVGPSTPVSDEPPARKPPRLELPPVKLEGAPGDEVVRVAERLRRRTPSRHPGPLRRLADRVAGMYSRVPRPGLLLAVLVSLAVLQLASSLSVGTRPMMLLDESPWSPWVSVHRSPLAARLLVPLGIIAGLYGPVFVVRTARRFVYVGLALAGLTGLAMLANEAELAMLGLTARGLLLAPPAQALLLLVLVLMGLIPIALLESGVSDGAQRVQGGRFFAAWLGAATALGLFVALVVVAMGAGWVLGDVRLVVPLGCLVLWAGAILPGALAERASRHLDAGGPADPASEAGRSSRRTSRLATLGGERVAGRLVSSLGLLLVVGGLVLPILWLRAGGTHAPLARQDLGGTLGVGLVEDGTLGPSEVRLVTGASAWQPVARTSDWRHSWYEEQMTIEELRKATGWLHCALPAPSTYGGWRMPFPSAVPAACAGPSLRVPVVELVDPDPFM